MHSGAKWKEAVKASRPDAVSPSSKIRVAIIAAILPVCVLLLSTKISLAASATWSANPSSSDWNTASNWVPMTVPNGPSDTATFQTSNQTLVRLSANTEVNGIIFNSGASSFGITNGPALTLTISGTGITNNSGITQTFVISNVQNGTGHLAFINAANAGDFTNQIYNTPYATTSFSNSASAGSATFIDSPYSIISFSSSSTAGNGTFTNSHDSSMSFSNSSTAASANVTLLGCCGSEAPNTNSSTAVSANVTLPDGANPRGAQAVFLNNSSAANALFTINGSQASDGFQGAVLEFFNTSGAGSSSLITNGGVGGGLGGRTVFTDNSAAMTATLIANTGASIGEAGNITFSGNATGDMAPVKVFGNGNLDISEHDGPGVAVGSIEGDGYVFLGARTLTVGTNNASTTFSGQIQDNYAGGSLVKTGTGTLVFTNSNTYTGGTMIDSGTLRASHDLALGGAPQNGGYVSVGPDATLTLDSGATNDYIAYSVSLTIVTGSTVNLNFTGNPDRLRSLILDGVSQPPGLYGGPDSGAPNQFSQFTGPGQILATTKAVSRKVHGAAGSFDVDLPLIGPPGIECRSGGGSGGDYQLVLTFFNNVTFTNAAVTQGTGMVASTSGNGTPTVTVNLTGVANAQIISVALFNLNDGVNTTNLVIPMGILVGDVNANGVVNASDVVQTKAQVGQPVTMSNFRADVNPNGIINASDVVHVKLLVGTSLPP
jgi:autotransporter-associated beta strand protein